MRTYGFRRARSGRIVVRFTGDERAILQVMVRSLVQLVEPTPRESEDPLADLVGIDPQAQAPTDPVLQRLLPDGYDADEPEASAEFRRFTERGLRETKVANATRVLDFLDRTDHDGSLEADEVSGWLGALNDLRLVIGTRLEVTDDHAETDRRIEDLGRTVLLARDEGEGSSPEAARALELLATYQAYDWLTMLQESLVQALARD